MANPLSGHGRGTNIWKELETSLEQNQIPYVAKITQKAGETKDFASSLIQVHSVTKLLLIGGDGTIYDSPPKRKVSNVHAVQSNTRQNRQGYTQSL
ncbi:diacylglycerol kinase family protein [Paenibacillus sp. MAH-36]|uniref:diacylglycerol kinase family protein n=1 Tax=Paenibacillus TaxID=44249 RepID=UPI00361A2C7B